MKKSERPSIAIPKASRQPPTCETACSFASVGTLSVAGSGWPQRGQVLASGLTCLWQCLHHHEAGLALCLSLAALHSRHRPGAERSTVRIPHGLPHFLHFGMLAVFYDGRSSLSNGRTRRVGGTGAESTFSRPLDSAASELVGEYSARRPQYGVDQWVR